MVSPRTPWPTNAAHRSNRGPSGRLFKNVSNVNAVCRRFTNTIPRNPLVGVVVVVVVVVVVIPPCCACCCCDIYSCFLFVFVML